MGEGRFTGRHAAMIFAGAFGVIISVNLLLAYSAIRTFPGLEVRNSYVASQNFDRRRAAQQALGWRVSARVGGGRLVLRITDAAGRPVQVARLQATLGRATHVKADFTPEFSFDGAAYVAPAALAPGNWNLRLRAWAEDGTAFMQRVPIFVAG